jgi:poly(A) polymerase Pap1
MKYKNKDGIELNYKGNDSHKILVREVISEAVRLCGEYNWHDEISMRFALQNTKDFLIENFDLEKKNG